MKLYEPCLCGANDCPRCFPNQGPEPEDEDPEEEYCEICGFRMFEDENGKLFCLACDMKGRK